MLRRTSNENCYESKNNEDNNITNETFVQKSEPVEFRPFLGLFYACLQSISNQLTSVIVKKLPYINPGIFVGILPIAIYHTAQIFGERKYTFLLLLRGFFGATGVYFQFIAYSYLPLVEASIIMSTMPIVTAVMARILLKEAYGLVQCISLILTVCGVLLVLRLPQLVSNRNSIHFDFTYVAGLMAAVGCVFFLSFSAIIVRKLKKVFFSVLVLYLSAVGILENSVLDGIFIPLVPSNCGLDQILSITLGIAAFASACLLTLAIQVQPAGIAAVEKSSFDILVTIVFQILFFKIYPDWYVIGGACIVIASLTIVGIRNWILVVYETSKT